MGAIAIFTLKSYPLGLRSVGFLLGSFCFRLTAEHGFVPCLLTLAGICGTD